MMFSRLTREHELMAPMPVWMAVLFKWVVVLMIVVYSLFMQLVVAEWIEGLFNS